MSILCFLLRYFICFSATLPVLSDVRLSASRFASPPVKN